MRALAFVVAVLLAGTFGVGLGMSIAGDPDPCGCVDDSDWADA